MPYKDPELKRQWEGEHREQRNARRRRSAASEDQHSIEMTVSDPIPGGNAQMLTLLIGLALACAFVAVVWLTNREFRAKKVAEEQYDD